MCFQVKLLFEWMCFLCMLFLYFFFASSFGTYLTSVVEHYIWLIKKKKKQRDFLPKTFSFNMKWRRWKIVRNKKENKKRNENIASNSKAKQSKKKHIQRYNISVWRIHLYKHFHFREIENSNLNNLIDIHIFVIPQQQKFLFVWYSSIERTLEQRYGRMKYKKHEKIESFLHKIISNAMCWKMPFPNI